MKNRVNQGDGVLILDSNVAEAPVVNATPEGAVLAIKKETLPCWAGGGMEEACPE